MNYTVTWYDGGNCDIEQISVQAFSWKEAISAAEEILRGMGTLGEVNEDAHRVIVELD